MVFKLGKSRWFVFYVLSVQLFAVACLLLIFSGWFVCVFLLITAMLFYRYRHIFFCMNTIVAIQYSVNAEWILHDVNDSVVRAQLQPSSVMWRHLLILRFDCMDNHERKTIVLFSDCFSLADYRALRRCVKMGYF